MEAANLHTFLKSKNTENQTFVLSRQCGHRTIPSYFVHHLATRYSYAVVSGMHDASVVRSFICGPRLYCG